MKRRVLLGVVIGAIVIVALVFGITALQSQSSPDIVAGSSLIASIVRDVAGDKLETLTLIPPGVCPGHYDIKASHIKALANCKALLIHDYQANFQNVKNAIAAADRPDLVVVAINVTGNWMVPSVQAEAVTRIAQLLGEIDPENAAFYQARAAQRAQAILTKGEEVKARLAGAGVNGTKVLCAEMQQGFVRWAGFNITATFGRPEDLSPEQKAGLIDQAREAGVALVIDNLQSGADTLGASICAEAGVEAVPVTISNFPGGLPNTETWDKAIDRNVDLLLAALDEWREKHG